MIQLIVTDLDNTLLLPDGTLGAYTATILEKCRRQNIIVVFATARPFRTTTSVRNVFMPEYSIANNGAEIYQETQLLLQRCMGAAEAQAIVAAAKQCKAVSCISVEAEGAQYTNYDGPPWSSENWNLVYTTFAEPLPANVSKIAIEAKDMHPMEQVVEALSSVHLYNNSGEQWCQIMHTDATKLNGVRKICKREGISLGDVVAFGDDFNEVPMLQACGKGIVVANGAEAAKNAADEICAHNETEGVARWIEQYVLK